AISEPISATGKTQPSVTAESKKDGSKAVLPDTIAVSSVVQQTNSDEATKKKNKQNSPENIAVSAEPIINKKSQENATKNNSQAIELAKEKQQIEQAKSTEQVKKDNADALNKQFSNKVPDKPKVETKVKTKTNQLTI
ncbi:MAG: hypothetical protein C4292_01230, partial [Nitrososphaera sp.]